MKAIGYTQYGSPDVLQVKEIDKPVPRENELLIRVYASGVNASDCAFRKGEPFITRFFAGLMRPKMIPGGDLAGEIEAVGNNVTLFQEGDQVFGSTGADSGAHAEYICLPEDGALALKPSNMTYAEAAAVCEGWLTALPFLRDEAHLQSGQQILINGASGSVGTSAVQLAKHLGAEVAGVCSGANVELVRSLGADKVIDYTKEDFSKTGQTYDVIFDAVGKSSFSSCKELLKPGGVYLTTVPSLAILFQMFWTSKIGNRKAIIAFTGLRPPKEKAKDLNFIKGLLEEGKIDPVIERSYPFKQAAEAHRHVDTGHKKGNVVITLDNNCKI